jgi:hypothetical protein
MLEIIRNEREMPKETGLARREAMPPERFGRHGISRALTLYSMIMAVLATARHHRLSIGSHSYKKSAMLHDISLRKAVAQLVDSIIVILPLIITPVIAHQMGAFDLPSIYSSAPLLSTAAFSGGIALFLAWGVSYFLVSEFIFGMTPGKAILGRRGIGKTFYPFKTGRSILGWIKHTLKNLFNIKAPFLAKTSPVWIRPGRKNFHAGHALLQHDPIPLPQTIIDVTA